MKIGIFDSGLGGLVFLKKLIEQNKYAHFVFYGDYKHNPLGNKNDMQLEKYFDSAMSFFMKEKCDKVIIACNTMASVILKKNLDVITPIPFVLNQILTNEKKKFLILATKKTIKNKIYHNKNTIDIACPLFVKKLEKNPRTDMTKIIDKYLKNVKDYDGIVLGCTHYSLLIDDLKKYINKDVLIIDSSLELANHIDLDNKELKIDIYINKENKNIKENIDWLFNKYPYEIHKLR